MRMSISGAARRSFAATAASPSGAGRRRDRTPAPRSRRNRRGCRAFYPLNEQGTHAMIRGIIKLLLVGWIAKRVLRRHEGEPTRPA